MKRYLKKDSFQLSDHEKENLWLGIKDGAGSEEKTAPSRRLMRPVLGLTTVLAAVLALVIFVGDDEPLVQPIALEPTAEEIEETEKTVTVAGRVLAKGTGQPLANANILIEGTKSKLDISMEPMMVASLESFGMDETAARKAAPKKSESSENVKPTVNVLEYQSETFDHFAIESVDDALSKSAGVKTRPGEIYTRGGRSGEVATTMDAAPIAAVPPHPSRQHKGSVTGGTTAPNGEPYELMYFDHTGVNPFVATEDDSLSTFAVDVDNASYTVARRYIDGGSLPPQEAIRVEEFINFFDAGYPLQSKETFAINFDGAPSRFGSGYQMVRIGLQGKSIPDENRKSANLVFLIDISGSMDRENRLGLVKKSLRILLDELSEGDRVGIVVYGSHAEVRLHPTDISRRDVILGAIDGLRTNGSTNAYDGLKVAYHMARKNYESHKLNRLILCSDGVANMGGSTKAEEMLEEIRMASDKGITLSTIGFGMGNYNDVLMEKLADQGDGNYYYVDQPKEADRVFRENLTGLLQTIARQVKVQVVFDESMVKRWRLLGYENRDVADRDFRNDDVDAGEVGAGHRVTALYEIKLADGVDEGLLGTVHLRYELPTHDSESAGQIKEISRELSMEQLASSFSKAPARYRLQVVVTEFAEILRGSYWAKESRLEDLVPLADALAEELAGDKQVEELAGLIRKAADLQSEMD